MIKPDLLRILVCPDCREPLLLTPDDALVCTDPKTRRRYRIEEGIPVLLIEESTVLEPGEHERLVAEAQKLPVNQKAQKARTS